MDDKSPKFGWLDAMLAAGMALVTVGVGVGIKSNLSKKSQVELIKAVTPTVVQSNLKVVFDIGGEVQKPGVYKLPLGSRVDEAIKIAGGMSSAADKDWVSKNLNMAKKLNDGEKIYIPKKNINDKVSVTDSEKTVLGVVDNGIININTASLEQLDKLDGVGPSIAGRIIEYREKNGGFKNINELKLVPGIGDKMYEKIKDSVGI